MVLKKAVQPLSSICFMFPSPSPLALVLGPLSICKWSVPLFPSVHSSLCFFIYTFSCSNETYATIWYASLFVYLFHSTLLLGPRLKKYIYIWMHHSSSAHISREILYGLAKISLCNFGCEQAERKNLGKNQSSSPIQWDYKTYTVWA